MKRTNRHALRSLLRVAEGKTYRFAFADGDELSAKLVSATHIDLDGTVVLFASENSSAEPAWQVHLEDIRSIYSLDGTCLFDAG